MEDKKSILLIDDNPEYYDEIIQSLKELYNVVVVLSLKSAERLLYYRSFDLAIVDMMMSARGYENFEEFRAGLMFYDSVIRAKHPKMPTIIWSVIDEVEEYKNKKLELGENVDNLYYCYKDWGSKMFETIESILNQ